MDLGSPPPFALLTPPSPYTFVPDPQQPDLSLLKSSFCCLHRFAGAMCVFGRISFFLFPQNHNYTAKLPARNLPPASPAKMCCWAAPPAPPKAFTLVPAAVGVVLTPKCFCMGLESSMLGLGRVRLVSGCGDLLPRGLVRLPLV